MRSVADSARRTLLAACVAATSCAALPAHAEEQGTASIEQVDQVVARMKADPALNSKHTEHELRWKNRTEKKAQPDAPAPHWLVELARWLSNATRGLMWVLGAVAVAIFAVFAWRWASVRSDALRARAEMRPSFVNELDIRPESLPRDIAAAARALVRRGDVRAALSLLYRGALSRLVHEHAVPIRAASTEGECLRLAARVLPDAGSAYFARLVAAWQTEVYAGRSAAATTVDTLCDEFDAHFASTSTDADQQTAAVAAA